MLEISIEQEHEFAIARDLEGIRDMLKSSLQEDSSKPDGELIRSLTNLLLKVPAEHVALLETIQKLLKQVAV